MHRVAANGVLGCDDGVPSASVLRFRATLPPPRTLPMRIIPLATALAFAFAAVPATLHGQFTEIGFGTPVEQTVTQNLVDDGVWLQTFIAAEAVKPGMTLTFHVRWLTGNSSPILAFVTEGGDLLGESQPMTPQQLSDGSAIMTRTFTRAGRFMLRVGGPGTPVGHRFSLTITEGRYVPTNASSAAAYKTTGFEFSAGYGPVEFSSDIATERGAGPAGRIAYNFGTIALFGEGQFSEMSADEGDADDEYQLLHGEGGARLYLLPTRMRFRPYGQAAWGVRRMKLTNGVEAEGMGPTFGAGAHFFLSENLSLEGAWRQSSGDIDRVRASSTDEWQDIPSEFVITGKSTRIYGMLSVHF